MNENEKENLKKNIIGWVGLILAFVVWSIFVFLMAQEGMFNHPIDGMW